MAAETASVSGGSPYAGRSHYRARYYDLSVGRFISEDPLGFEGGDTDLYRFVLNSPTNLYDPTGNCPWCKAGLSGALGGAAVDVGIQLLQNGGKFKCINWRSAAVAAGLGAALSTLSPTGPLLGRGGARARAYGYPPEPGFFNRTWNRFGWSYDGSGDVLNLRLGRLHKDIPFTRIPAGANPFRDGGIAGALAGGATGLARPSQDCECKSVGNANNTGATSLAVFLPDYIEN